MIKTRKIVLCLAGLLLPVAACSGTSASEAPAPNASGQSKVVLLGDSVAAGEALPLTAAFQASGVGFESLAAAGGGNVVGPFSDKNWEQLPGQLATAKPTVVVYQIASYDWGTQAEQQAAYTKLLDTVSGTGAKLAFVSMPPIKADEFYQPHVADLQRTAAVAKTVADGSGGKAVFLDATAVWGPTYQQTRDGKADRSADGIHTCPQGAARFTSWLLPNLTGLLPGFTPAAASTWANTGWSGDKRFKGC
ncbi:SGNH/GDSL hydrolase family protein [Amycolatopsis benzoatilytica]|uniref:SGNH/GDSL hydrolase family protein n=1 Tax=Amycolatopsis benzoatilytica TaxID=346045 RepID=UPI0003769929|nr:SGNH/GDSL hydrolase family protein [Amycolatopsis benzoatilytica]